MSDKASVRIPRKTFLLMPLLLSQVDLVGMTRQIAVTAYSFGDGF
ncbi:MAG: hypothetical protein R6U51_09855 [Anaerolineales bacterium]